MDREEALAAWEQDDWAKRAEAATVLAAFTDDHASAALGWLLLDPMDTGVTSRAAHALLARNDPHGAALVFAALALCNPSQGDWIYDELRQATQSGGFDLVSNASAVLAGDNPWARYGAREALNHFHLSPID